MIPSTFLLTTLPRVGAGVKVFYRKGCEITEGTHGWDEFYRNNVKLADPAAQPAMIDDAVAAARKAGVAIVVAGVNEGTCREARSQQHLGDRGSRDLLGAQSDLIKEVLATETPTVLVLIDGLRLTRGCISGQRLVFGFQEVAPPPLAAEINGD